MGGGGGGGGWGDTDLSSVARSYMSGMASILFMYYFYLVLN